MPTAEDRAKVRQGSKEPPRPVPCDVCGGPTYEVRCEIICRRCGFTRDCSDP